MYEIPATPSTDLYVWTSESSSEEQSDDSSGEKFAADSFSHLVVDAFTDI